MFFLMGEGPAAAPPRGGACAKQLTPAQTTSPLCRYGCHSLLSCQSIPEHIRLPILRSVRLGFLQDMQDMVQADRRMALAMVTEAGGQGAGGVNFHRDLYTPRRVGVGGGGAEGGRSQHSSEIMGYGTVRNPQHTPPQLRMPSASGAIFHVVDAEGEGTVNLVRSTFTPCS
jgi:hypothetical protein